MINYSEITYEDRIVIETLYNLKKSQAEIARTLGKTPSAINQELKRHDQYADVQIKHRYRYQAHVAQYRAEEAKQQCGRPKTKLTDRDLKLIKEKLEEGWSPAQIAHVTLKKKISSRTLYNMINYRQIPDVQAETHLLYKAKRFHRAINASMSSSARKRIETASRIRTARKRTTFLKAQENKSEIICQSITDRPEVITSRQQFGHFEFDGVESSKSNALVLTIIERKTRMFFALKLDNKRAETVAQALDQFLYTYGDIVKSMTSDRGKEFVNQTVSRVFKEYNVTHYVAHAYSAYERGTNENLNAVFRRHFPKGTDFKPVKQLDLQKASDSMNQRPLQIFKYASTPAREFKSAVNRSRSHSKRVNHGRITIESTQRMYQH